MAHKDKYGQIVTSDFSSKVKVMINTETSNSKGDIYPPILDGTTTFDTKAGLVQI